VNWLEILVQSSTSEACPLVLGSLSAEALVAACLETRDELVWTEFVHRFHPVISTVVLRAVRNCGGAAPSLRDDLVQETYLKLCADNCRLLRNFQSHHAGAIFGFLKVVTSNVVLDHFKAAHAAKRGGGGVTASLEDHEPKEERFQESLAGNSASIEQTILLHEIDRCLARNVSPSELTRSRRIFWLYYRCGLSARAIASLSEINLTTKGVESILFRLNRAVRTALAPPDCQKIEPPLREKGVTSAGSF
jgi:RNA polymerase sigma-70 factor, ECF subfamily